MSATTVVVVADPILISVMEAARLLSLKPWEAHQLCTSGVLASGKQGRRLSVSMASVREYAGRVLQGEAS